MSERMQTRSQGPPVSPNIEREANPFPNPEQIARDQADAVRLANLAVQGEVGLANNANTDNTGVEQGEIPPVSTENQVVYGIPQDTGENSPENDNRRETTEQENITGEIPPNQDREMDEVGVIGGGTLLQGTPQQPTKVEEVSREENTKSPSDLVQGIVDGQQFMDDNLSDVMRNSAIASNLSSLLNFIATTMQKPEKPATLDWILPDGLNSKLESITTKEIADFPAPGTSNGAMIVDIPNIEPYFNTKRFLVDLHTGDLFAAMHGTWYRLEVGCKKNRVRNRKPGHTSGTRRSKTKEAITTHRQRPNDGTAFRPSESESPTNSIHPKRIQLRSTHRCNVTHSPQKLHQGQNTGGRDIHNGIQQHTVVETGGQSATRELKPEIADHIWKDERGARSYRRSLRKGQ